MHSDLLPKNYFPAGHSRVFFIPVPPRRSTDDLRFVPCLVSMFDGDWHSNRHVSLFPAGLTDIGVVPVRVVPAARNTRTWTPSSPSSWGWATRLWAAWLRRGRWALLQFPFHSAGHHHMHPLLKVSWFRKVSVKVNSSETWECISCVSYTWVNMYIIQAAKPVYTIKWIVMDRKLCSHVHFTVKQQ